jgi:DNA-binding GntR family transcriptional regulator
MTHRTTRATGRTGPDRGDGLVAIESRELSQLAYSSIRAAIRDMTLKPGAHLVESALAKRLGTSSMPVREALLMLERDGFVRTIPFRGAFVTTLDRRDVAEIFELRELLEGRAAAHAARLLDDESIDRLGEIIRIVDDGIARRDVRSCHDIFIEFDDIIFEATDNARLAWNLGNLRDQIARIGIALVAIPGRLEQSQAEHVRVYEAIRAHDTDAAEAEMAAHVRSLERSLLESGEGYFDILRGEKEPTLA